MRLRNLIPTKAKLMLRLYSNQQFYRTLRIAISSGIFVDVVMGEN